MYKTLCPGAIGVQAHTLQEIFQAAKLGGFEGVEVPIGEIADLVESQGASATRALFDEAGLRAAAWGLPVDWRNDEASWKGGLEGLPRLANAAAAIGCLATMTYILPGSNELDYEANYAFHVERFTPIAAILADHGCSLGLEFIGPKTLRDTYQYPFVHTMQGMLDMGQEIGSKVGLLLDCWHWYTSHSNVGELLQLRPEQVVYVHVNDAPDGLERDEQVDNVRCLPGETGIIDIQGFLGALRQIGYAGPVTPEPFKKELGDLPDDAARLRTVGAAMAQIMD